MIDITISIVLYHNDENELESVVNLLNKSILQKKIYLVDNSSNDSLKRFASFQNVEYIFNNANIGYGAAHNIAIKRAKDLSKYHLILNADVDFDPEVLKKSSDYLGSKPDVVMISPQILWPDGRLQHFSRKLPSPFDLFIRRFIPKFLRPLFKRKLADYILLHRDYTEAMNIPNLPGCFMFVRTSVLNEVNGFDENFFMYVEDIDLTRRLHQKGKTLYFPEVSIKHALAQGSARSFKLLKFHVNSTIYYFNKWGWFNDKDRIEINKTL